MESIRMEEIAMNFRVKNTSLENNTEEINSLENISVEKDSQENNSMERDSQENISLNESTPEDIENIERLCETLQQKIKLVEEQKEANKKILDDLEEYGYSSMMQWKKENLSLHKKTDQLYKETRECKRTLLRKQSLNIELETLDEFYYREEAPVHPHELLTERMKIEQQEEEMLELRRYIFQLRCQIAGQIERKVPIHQQRRPSRLRVLWRQFTTFFRR